MSVLQGLVIVLAGVAAGGINAVVGSGTLITFPTLLFFGYPALAANVSNNIGMVAGGLSGVHGYRKELRGYGALLRRLVPASLVGAITGALLLVLLPPSAFAAIVPALIALSVLLVIFGPVLNRRFAPTRVGGADNPTQASPVRNRLLLGALFVAGMYGGYFGAAQGVLLIGVMNVLMSYALQRINAFKNVLSTVVNAVAALTFMVVAWKQIDWAVVLLVGLGALVGGYLGARVGRRLPPVVLRSVIVVVGVAAIAKMLFFS